ncbi:hypothetical protein HN954_05175 [bacterium]|jgi:hypothetical protein|nr:hypothetical protein [bacterium]MBT6831985.1 hypothetical protein [bacterium]MBT6996785.1 hypothetical protein [bacterium]MBT7772090.1 hypothetical protein [bacterium]
MLTSFLDARKTWVLVDGAPPDAVGRVVDAVVNPDDGKIEAFWVRAISGLRLLLPDDILRWRREIFIDGENDLSAPEHSPRLGAILDREVPILGAKVFLELENKKQKLGKVWNFSFDTLSPKILSIEVYHGFWMFASRMLISRTRILRITSDGIFVGPNILRVPEKKKPILEKNTEILPEPERSESSQR